MHRSRLAPLTLLASLLLLAGCATAPTPAAEPVLTTPEPSELNLPAPSAVEPGCDCDAAPPEQAENHFDRGVRALAARDYTRARIYFERHRESGGEQSVREADVGIAFVTLLDRSEQSTGPEQGASGVDERAEVMILAMAAIELLEGQLDRLTELNRALAGDLEKREEALKRLRDLTLGQPEG